jgi:hypothetical protein
MLTSHEIRKLTRKGMYCDGGGLLLEVSNGGRGKSWLFKFYIAGKQRQMGLGSLKDVSLAQARALAHECRAMVKAGLDPIIEREKNKAAAGGQPPCRVGLEPWGKGQDVATPMP